MILVTAANGNQGKWLMPKLLASGASLRACVRSSASTQALRVAGVADVVVGDITEPDVLARAINGVEKVYYVGPTLHPKERISSAVIGREVSAEYIDPKTFFKLRHGGADPSLFQYEMRLMRAIGTHYSNHDFIGNPNVLTWLLGRSPTTWAHVCAAGICRFSS